MNKILCYNCSNLIEIDPGEFWEYREEETCSLEKCNNCGKVNSIYYTTSPDFDAREADEEDLEEFN